MSMPITWVEKIFLKLSLVYGRDFTGRYEGVSLADVKTDWAHELSGFENHPDSIKHALQHLPVSKPPTVYEFRNLAASAPRMANLELPRPPQDPAIVAIIKAGLKPLAENDGKEWARRLQRRHVACERLNSYQIMSYRMALGIKSAG